MFAIRAGRLGYRPGHSMRRPAAPARTRAASESARASRQPSAARPAVRAAGQRASAAHSPSKDRPGRAGPYPRAARYPEAERLIEGRLGGRAVRADVEEAEQAKGHGGQEVPAEEGEVEHEHVPLLTVRQALALGKGRLVTHLRILGDQVGNHAVLVRLDDTGNHEKQAPQAGEEVAEEHGLHALQIVIVESGGQLLGFGRVQQEGVHREGGCSDNEPDQQRPCGKGEVNAQRDALEGVHDVHMIAVAGIDFDAILIDVHRVTIALDVDPVLVEIDAVALIKIPVIVRSVVPLRRIAVVLDGCGLRHCAGRPGGPGRKRCAADRDGEHQRHQHRFPVVGLEACLALGLEFRTYPHGLSLSYRTAVRAAPKRRNRITAHAFLTLHLRW